MVSLCLRKIHSSATSATSGMREPKEAKRGDASKELPMCGVVGIVVLFACAAELKSDVTVLNTVSLKTIPYQKVFKKWDHVVPFLCRVTKKYDNRLRFSPPKRELHRHRQTTQTF